MALLSLLLLGGCPLRDVLPGPAVRTGNARAAFEAAAPPVTTEGAPVVYSGPPRTAYPVLPVQVWGLRYALDLVLVSDSPDWVMHEYARIDLPDGPLWIAKDAGRDREQSIVADIDDIESWVPEAPVRRHRRELVVDDNSSPEALDLHLAYENTLGQSVEVRYSGEIPTRASDPRNGNTMGHSAGSVAALLDLYLFRIGGKAQISINEEPRKLHRLLGLLPEVYLLAQVQGGFAVTDFCQGAAPGGFTLRRPCTATDWPTRSEEAWEVGEDGWASRTGGPTELRYHFTEGELDRAVALQVGVAEPLVTVVVSPRLPDLRRPFAGESRSDFVVDINGQEGHGTGCIRTRWTDADTVAVELIPTAPHWFADRPMRGEVHHGPDGTAVTMQRSEVGTLRGC